MSMCPIKKHPEKIINLYLLYGNIEKPLNNKHKKNPTLIQLACMKGDDAHSVMI